MNDYDEDTNEIDDRITALVPGYLENRRKDLVILKESLERKDLMAIDKIAHKVKGTALGYGLVEVDRIARELDEAIRNGDWDAIRKSIYLLEDYLRN